MLNAKDAAARLNITVRQLNRYQQAGLLRPVQRVPRGRRQFREEDVDRLLQDRENP